VAAGQVSPAPGTCCVYDRAEAAARVGADRARAQFGERSAEFASACDDLLEALLLNGRGAAGETIALAEGTVEANKSLRGADDVGQARSLVNLADALVAAGTYDRAIVLLQRAVALHERRASDGRNLSDTLDHLGSALTAAGRFDAALGALERSLRIKESLPASSGRDIARTLERTGFARQRKGEYEKAADPVRRADQLRRGVDADDPEYVQTLNLLAQQLWFEGRLHESMDTSERALSLAERTLRPDHPTVARALRFLAGTLEDLGELQRAHALRERALAIVEGAFGPNHYETAVFLNSAAMSDLSLGDYPAARALFDRATRAFEAQFGPWHDYVATTRSNLAQVDAWLGDYAAARREQARATAIWERTLGANHPFVAVALTELAIVFREQGEAAQALPLLQRALAIQQRALGPRHRDVARLLTNLAATDLKLGNIGIAQRHAAQALQIWQEQPDPETPDFAAALTLYGELQLRRGAVADARKYYSDAAAIRARVFGREHPAFAEAQAGLALALAASGEFAEALASASEAEHVSRDHLRLMLAHLPERQALNYSVTRPKGLDLILSLAATAPDAPAIGLDEAIRSRALVLDEMGARRGDRHDSGADNLLWSSLQSAQERLANLVVRGPGEMPTARYAALVDEARTASELAELKLAGQNGEFRADMTRSRMGLADVAAAIPSGSAVVSYVRYTRSAWPPIAALRAEADAVARRPVQEIPSYIALILRPGVPVAAVSLGSASVIDASVSEWRDAIAAHVESPGAAPGPSGVSRAAGARLRRLIWDPLVPQVGQVNRVFIVPDGTLSLVPFAALPVGQRSYLIESGPLIHYLSAERDLVPSRHPVSSSHGFLAIGAPAFGTRTPVSGSQAISVAALRGVQPCGYQEMSFTPLDGTLREVRELSAMWNARPSGDGEMARVLTGKDATESAFKRDAHQYRILHIATHGFSMVGDCRPAPAGTRGVGGLVPGRTLDWDSPLLLSGVALAGANRRVRAGSVDEDGVLTAGEVASLDLSGVEWAVLSACDTGVGEVRPGEGVLGLRRAFQIAGVRTVVMSLWSVEDMAARDWMRALYQGRIEKQLGTAEAVRRAGLQVLRDRRASGRSTDPFYWAAFVAAGDWD